MALSNAASARVSTMEPSSASLSITCLRDPEAAALRLEEIAGRTGGGRMAEETGHRHARKR